MAVASRTAPPKNDTYTVLLGISLGAMVLGCILLLMDYMDYGSMTPPAVPAPQPPRAAAPVALPGQAPGLGGTAAPIPADANAGSPAPEQPAGTAPTPAPGAAPTPPAPGNVPAPPAPAPKATPQ